MWLRSAKDPRPARDHAAGGTASAPSTDLTSPHGPGVVHRPAAPPRRDLRRRRLQARRRRRRALRAAGDAHRRGRLRRRGHAEPVRPRPSRASASTFPLNEYRATLEDGRAAARAAAARQGAHLGGPAEARPRHAEPGAHGVPVQLPGPDRRRRVPVVPESRRRRPGADRARGAGPRAHADDAVLGRPVARAQRGEPRDLQAHGRAAPEHGAQILALARDSAQTGEPIVRSLEYAYPHQGYTALADEFLLGPTSSSRRSSRRTRAAAGSSCPPGAGRVTTGASSRVRVGRDRRAARAPAVVPANRVRPA